MLKIVLWMTDHMFYLGCTWHTPYPESVSLNIRFGMKSRNRAAVLISGSGVQHLLARSLRARRRLRSKNFSLSHLLRKSLLRRDRPSVRPQENLLSLLLLSPPSGGNPYMTSASNI